VQLEPFDLAIPREDITDLDCREGLARQAAIDNDGPSIAHVRDHLSCHFTGDSVKAGSGLEFVADLFHLQGEILFVSCTEHVVESFNLVNQRLDVLCLAYRADRSNSVPQCQSYRHFSELRSSCIDDHSGRLQLLDALMHRARCQWVDQGSSSLLE